MHPMLFPVSNQNGIPLTILIARGPSADLATGISLRALAKALKRSPSLLRHLLEALQAPPEDQSLARQGKLTTNELVRRAREAGSVRETSKREALERKRTIQASQNGCKAISDWLVAEGISGPTGAQIVNEARTTLAIAEHNKKLPETPHYPECRTVRSFNDAGRLKTKHRRNQVYGLVCTLALLMGRLLHDRFMGAVQSHRTAPRKTVQKIRN